MTGKVDRKVLKSTPVNDAEIARRELSVLRLIREQERAWFRSEELLIPDTT